MKTYTFITLIALTSFLLNCKKQNKINVLKDEKVQQKTTSKVILNSHKTVEKKIDSTSAKYIEAYLLKNNYLIVNHTKYIIGDINNDNLLDVAIFYVFAAKSGGNARMGEETAVFLNDGEELNFKTKYVSNDLCIPKKIIDNKIYVTTYEYDVNDYPHSPSIETYATLTLHNNSLKYTITNHKETTETILDSKYVIAESGLLYRDKPNGVVIDKFSYATQVDIIEYTNQTKTIIDNGKEINGQWVGVKIRNRPVHKAYVFSGYLANYSDLDNHKIIATSTPNFIKSKNECLLLPKTYNVYNKSLEKINNIDIKVISPATIINITTHERPETKNQNYCDWSHYVEVLYKGQKIILFGDKILSISSNEQYKLDNYNINLILAENLTMEAADSDGLTGCDDYSNFLIKYNNTYSFLEIENENNDYKILHHDDGSTEQYEIIGIDKDTLKIKIDQSFQEGTGEYKLNIYNKNGWKCKQYDKIRN